MAGGDAYLHGDGCASACGTRAAFSFSASEKRHPKNGVPTGRKLGAGLAKSFPTGRKSRENSIDNTPGLYVGSGGVVSYQSSVFGSLADSLVTSNWKAEN